MPYDIIGENHHVSINDPNADTIRIVKGTMFFDHINKTLADFGFNPTEKIEIVSLRPLKIIFMS